MFITRYAYINTTSSAGSPTEVELNTDDIIRVNCWFNSYGNPSYVFHMANGDFLYDVDDYGGMNDIPLNRRIVDRKKDMFI